MTTANTNIDNESGQNSCPPTEQQLAFDKYIKGENIFSTWKKSDPMGDKIYE